MSALDYIEAAHKSLREAREMAMEMPNDKLRWEAVAVIDEQIANVRGAFEEVADAEGL